MLLQVHQLVNASFSSPLLVGHSLQFSLCQPASFSHSFANCLFCVLAAFILPFILYSDSYNHRCFMEKELKNAHPF